MPPKLDWHNDPELIELMDFLLEKAREVKSPLNISQLAREFEENSGASQAIHCLKFRIRRLREGVAEMNAIDTTTKVEILFALSASIDENYLKELQKDADVEIDGNNRIIKYIANDGSLELNEAEKQNIMDESLSDSDDGSQNSTLKNPGSMKRSAPGMPNSSKKARIGSVKSEFHAPDDSERISEFRAREPNPEIQLFRQPKLEGAPGAHPHQEASGAPGPPTRPNIAPIALIPASSGANLVQTPQIMFLEAIQFLIRNLDMPNLFPLQAEIEKKLRESSANEKISNDEIILAIEVLVTKIVNRSVQNIPEAVESISLKVFMCFLKAAILNSKLEGLEALLEKIKQKIYEPASKDKNIPVEKVVRVLQYTLDGISF